MKLVRENINDYLPAPSEEEIEKRIENSNLSPDELFMKSAENGFLKGVKKALDQGADIHASKLKIIYTVENGHLDILKYLHQQGADITFNDFYLLTKAVQFGHLSIVKYLVENGFSPSYGRGRVALNLAVQRGYLDVAKYLVENGADKHIDKETLRLASQKAHKEFINYLKSQMKEENE